MARGSDSDSCTVLSAPRGGRTAVVEASVSLDYFTLARLCEQIDVAVAPALIDGHYYHVAPLAEKARIAQEGLVGGEAARRRNFPAYPRDPDCVYLWPAVVMAQTYADRDDQHLGAGAHLILEADLTSLDELCPDQEELARLWEEPEAFPGGEALKTRMEAERHTLPEGRTDSPAVLEAAIALIRALSPETRLLAVNVLALNGDPVWEAKIDELMEAVDKYVPQPDRAIDKPFLMPIEDIFSISGRGTVVTGRIERGKVKVGEACEIVGFRETRQTVCTGVEMFKKQLDEGLAGDNAGILLRGIPKEDVERGMVLAKPGSITPHTVFKGEVYVLSKEEGGRHTPFFKGYRPQFYFRTTDVTGVAELPEGVEMVMPGDNVQLQVELITPVALEKGLRFAIREGGRTVGAGTVSEIVK